MRLSAVSQSRHLAAEGQVEKIPRGPAEVLGEFAARVDRRGDGAGAVAIAGPRYRQAILRQLMEQTVIDVPRRDQHRGRRRHLALFGGEDAGERHACGADGGDRQIGLDADAEIDQARLDRYFLAG